MNMVRLWQDYLQFKPNRRAFADNPGQSRLACPAVIAKIAPAPATRAQVDVVLSRITLGGNAAQVPRRA